MKFSLTFDYLCPFARNCHEHVVTALEHGAPYEVTFLPFSLMQTHVGEDEPSVWERRESSKGLLALEVGVVVRDNFPDHFNQVHLALFAARHDRSGNLDDRSVIEKVLQDAGVQPDEVFDEVAKGWPKEAVKKSHEDAVFQNDIFGVPTFVVDGQAIFVRLMTRPKTNGRHTIDSVLAIVEESPCINEFKYTKIPR